MSDKNNRYALGIDGGGSKTAFTLIDEEGNIAQSFVLNGTAFDTYSLEEIKEVFLSAKEKLIHAPDAVFAGIGGIMGERAKETCSSLLCEVFAAPVCSSDNDSVNACYAIKGSGGSIILIAGTGSAAYGEYEQRRARSGGYCYQEGDLGSSYDIGRRALQYFGKGIDGRAEKGALFASIKDILGSDEPVAFASFMEKAGRKEIASFAKIVTMNESDPYSEKILIETSEEAYAMVEATYRRLNVDSGIPFGIIGGLGNADSLYRRHLLESVKSNLPHLKLYEGEIDAGKGSAYKAKELLWNGSSRQ